MRPVGWSSRRYRRRGDRGSPSPGCAIPGCPSIYPYGSAVAPGAPATPNHTRQECPRHLYTVKMMRRVLILALAGGALLWGQNAGGRGGGRGGARPAPSPLTRLLDTLREATSPDQAVRDVRTIWDTDRWFTFPKFEETAKNVAAIMKRAGLEDIEIANPPADGVTQGGFWTMPLAWDVKVGTLEILDPAVPADQRVLADYQKVPTSICMWSGPTPPGGVTTEVALAGPGPTPADVKGKLVLGGRAS